LTTLALHGINVASLELGFGECSAKCAGSSQSLSRWDARDARMEMSMSTYKPPPGYPPSKALGTGVLTYFVLTFAISWAGVLAVVGFDGFPGTAEDFRVLLPMVVIAMLAGPSVAGIAATALFLGKTGLRDVWQRVLKVRVGARWYVIALLTGPLMVTAVLMVLSLTSPVFRPGIITVSDPTAHLVLGLMTGLVAGLFEEIGWTGFAIPRLRLRHGIFVTGLIVGLMWGAWHLLVTWWGSTDTSGSLSMVVYLPAMTLSFLVPFRVLMVWVYDRTGSLSVAMLMHASLTASVRIFDPVPISGWSIVLYNLVLGAALWAVVAAVATAFPGTFKRSTATRTASAE
jgi:membrane protease YdiL (CAAX protease family)